VNANDLAAVKVNYAEANIICKNNVDLQAARNNAEGTEECGLF
jgi:hypothetical protein